MTILIAKIVRERFNNGHDYHVFTISIGGGEYPAAIYQGIDPPEVLKTVEYQLTGEWKRHPKWGKQFIIESYKRFQKTTSREERDEISLMVSAKKRL